MSRKNLILIKLLVEISSIVLFKQRVRGMSRRLGAREMFLFERGSAQKPA